MSYSEYTKADLMRLLESLTPGGSEFYESPENCARFIRERKGKMMGRCKNCRWWGRGGICEFVDTEYVFRGEAKKTDAAAFSITVQVDDDQGLDVWLKTGPEFGCVHFAVNGGQ